ncbi:MAG: cyclic nucleotide-binding and patatin-like phospholipase domain-containing protein [Cyanobacteriota bacterium]|nr:cyclic nucleotide-binding and patatin-like phospholipase domain-containing protein [Cyanobacteriota bacterium]
MTSAGTPWEPARALAAAFAASPLFSGLPLEEPELQHLEPIALPAGEILFQQGECGSLAYLVAHGVLGLYRSERSREPRLFRKACAGELIGEYALLCDEPRSAQARALVDCTLFAIDRACLQRLLKLESELPSRLIRQLALAASRGREDLSERPLITVLAHGSQRGDQAMEPLIAALRQAAGGRDASTGEATAQAATLTIEDHRGRDWSPAEQAATMIAALEQRRPSVYVVDRLEVVDPEHWPLVDRALVVCLGNAVTPSDLGAATAEGDAAARAVDLVRVWPAGQEQPEPLPPQPGLQRLQHIYNVREDRPADIERTARCILGTATVLVLGGGGAKGFAHLGALRALAEHGGPPIDMIFGISIGSFIGSLVALDLPLDAIRRTLIDVFVRRTPYSLTLPIHSLFRYNRHLRAIEPILKPHAVGDTWIPFRPGSVDLTTNQLVFWHEHNLLETVIASMSIPGLAPPVPMPSGGLHVDGAVLDNLPILEARRCTTGRVIALSLDHGEGQRTLATPGHQPRGLWRLMRRCGLVRQELPPITMTILQSMLCSARLKSDREERFADLLLKPNLTTIGILEWSAHDRVEQEGYRAMAAALSASPATTACTSPPSAHPDPA